MTDLRETIARALIADVERQTGDGWPVDTLGDGGLELLVDDMLDFGALADRILALPQIAEALKLTVVKPLNLGPSVSTGKRTPV